MSYKFDLKAEFKILCKMLEGKLKHNKGIVLADYDSDTDHVNEIIEDFTENQEADEDTKAKFARSVVRDFEKLHRAVDRGEDSPLVQIHEMKAGRPKKKLATFIIMYMATIQKDLKTVDGVVDFIIDVMRPEKKDKLRTFLMSHKDVSKRIDPETFRFFLFWHESAHVVFELYNIFNKGKAADNREECFADIFAIMMYHKRFGTRGLEKMVRMMVALRLANDVAHSHQYNGSKDAGIHHTIFAIKTVQAWLQNNETKNMTLDQIVEVAKKISQRAHADDRYYQNLFNHTPDSLKDWINKQPEPVDDSVKGFKHFVEEFSAGQNQLWLEDPKRPREIVAARVAQLEMADFMLAWLPVFATPLGTNMHVVARQIMKTRDAIRKDLARLEKETQISPRKIAANIKF